MTIRSTFALDKKTADGLARLARRWDVSKSEALRRAVARAEAQPSDGGCEMSPKAALKRLAEQPPLGKERADDWIAANRAARRASDALAARRHASRR